MARKSPKAAALPTMVADIRLFGDVDVGMLSEFFRQQAEVRVDKPVVFELSTTGGDAEIGRRIGLELKLWQDHGRQVFFLGKTFVYSAGITIMSFVPQPQRFMTDDCELLIHERKMKKDLHLEGALRGCRSVIHDVLAQIDSGQRLERAGFALLASGSTLTLEDIENRVLNRDWYMTAGEAHRLGLIAGVI